MQLGLALFWQGPMLGAVAALGRASSAPLERTVQRFGVAPHRCWRSDTNARLLPTQTFSGPESGRMTAREMLEVSDSSDHEEPAHPVLNSDGEQVAMHTSLQHQFLNFNPKP